MENITAQNSVTRNVTKEQFKAVYGALRTLCRTRKTFDFNAQASAEDSLIEIKDQIGKPYHFAIRAASLAWETR
jgi:hypothetical protein